MSLLLPPELSGRDKLLKKVYIAIERIKLGRASKSLLMIALRGVEKTILLDHMRNRATTDSPILLKTTARSEID